MISAGGCRVGVAGGRADRSNGGGHAGSADRAEPGAGRVQFGEEVSAKARHIDQFVTPVVGAGVEKLGSAGVCDIVRSAATQRMIDEVGDHEHGRCVPVVGGAHRRCQLIDRVERQELDTGRCVQPVAADAVGHGIHDTVGTARTVGVNGPNEIAGGVQQSVINGP